MRKHFVNIGAKRWILLILLSGILGGSLTGLLGIILGVSVIAVCILFLIGGFLFSGIIAVIALLDKVIAIFNNQLSISKKEINQQINNAETELKSTIAIRPFTTYPLTLDPWHKGYSATAHFLEYLVQIIETQKPKTILECGSGSSSIIIGSCLRSLSYGGQLISLEHDSYYVNKNNNLLGVEGLTDWVKIVNAPLKSWEINGKQWQWYDFNPEDVLTDALDLIIVDGPPGYIHPLSRYPALPVLKDFLSEDFIIVIDDGNRESETEIASRWAEMLNTDKHLNPEGRGIWVIESKE